MSRFLPNLWLGVGLLAGALPLGCRQVVSPAPQAEVAFQGKMAPPARDQPPPPLPPGNSPAAAGTPQAALGSLTQPPLLHPEFLPSPELVNPAPLRQSGLQVETSRSDADAGPSPVLPAPAPASRGLQGHQSEYLWLRGVLEARRRSGHLDPALRQFRGVRPLRRPTASGGPSADHGLPSRSGAACGRASRQGPAPDRLPRGAH